MSTIALDPNVQTAITEIVRLQKGLLNTNVSNSNEGMANEIIDFKPDRYTDKRIEEYDLRVRGDDIIFADLKENKELIVSIRNNNVSSICLQKPGLN